MQKKKDNNNKFKSNKLFLYIILNLFYSFFSFNVQIKKFKMYHFFINFYIFI